MIQKNFCTVDAARRLYDAGILLKTDIMWHHCQGEWLLMRQQERPDINYPAPTMADLWVELPCKSYIKKEENETMVWWNDKFTGVYSPYFRSVNPTDALIDLLIWIRRRGL